MSQAITIEAEITGELSAPLRLRAERYRDHVRASGEEAVKAFEELAGARHEAAHGEWGLFLQDAGIDDTTARVQLQLYEQMQADPRFGERFRQGWLTQGAGRELLSAPAEVKDEILSRPAESKPPTVAEVREAKKAATPNRATSHDLPAAPAPAPAAPKPALVLTPLTPEPAPAGSPTVIATVPAAGALPPMLQLGGAAAALPPPLFAPPPAANPAPAEEFTSLVSRLEAAGFGLEWEADSKHFKLREDRKLPGAVRETPGFMFSFYPATEWDACRRRAEHLLNPPPPVAADATPDDLPPLPRIVEEEEGDWFAVEDETGPVVIMRDFSLPSAVANASGHVAHAMQLIALGEARSVETELLRGLAREVEALSIIPSIVRGSLRTMIRLVADEADELARRAAPAAAPGPAPVEDLTSAAGLSIALAEAAGRVYGEHVPSAGDVARWQEALDALAPELDDVTYEGLAHRLGALREAARGAA